MIPPNRSWAWSVFAFCFLSVDRPVRADETSNPPSAQPALFGMSTLTFRAVPGWGSLPAGVSMGPTHGGVVVDKSGNSYFSTDNAAGIFVFNQRGAFVRTIGADFAGTLAMTLVNRGGQEAIYGVHFRRSRVFKMGLDGTSLQILSFPRAAGIYGPNGENFKPSAVAVAPDGAIFVADGFGTNYIHKYTAAGLYLGSFGGAGKEDGKMARCQGLVVDTRYQTPLLLVCDTDNLRLQYFDLDGNFVQIAAIDLRRPVAAAQYRDYMAIAELDGRVTILGNSNNVVSVLGDNPDRFLWGHYQVPPDRLKPEYFNAPHGVAWDAQGGLYIQEWSREGRLLKLKPAR